MLFPAGHRHLLRPGRLLPPFPLSLALAHLRLPHRRLLSHNQRYHPFDGERDPLGQVRLHELSQLDRVPQQELRLYDRWVF